MRLLGSTREKGILGSGGRRARRRERTAGRNRSRSCASRTGDNRCEFVAWSVSEGDIVDRVGMELEARNTGLERFPFHQSVLPLEERNLDSRNRRRSVRLHGVEQSPSLKIQVCLTLCITCGRDPCSSKGRDRQVHAPVRPQTRHQRPNPERQEQQGGNSKRGR